MPNVAIFAIVLAVALAGSAMAFSAVAVYRANTSSGLVEHMLRTAPPPKPAKAVVLRKREIMA